MQYIFENYRFDSSQQLLYKDDQIIPLKRNEALLLELFLSRPEDILSKDTILSEVWQERVVSEQVVFQNISHLRTIFSDQAIKTFPKKGYQWQLDVQPETVEQPTLVKTSVTQPFLLKLLFSAAILIALILFVMGNQQQSSAEKLTQTDITVIPFEAAHNETSATNTQPFNLALTETIKSEQFQFRLSAKDLSVRSFFNAPLITRETLNLSERNLLLSGFISSFKDGLLLQYRLQGASRPWSGYLFASSVETLAQQLHIRLNPILESQYFDLANDSLVTSELTLLHNKQPQDHEVLLRLIERHIEQRNFDVAMALVDTLISQSDPRHHTAYLGSGYMLKGKIFHLKSFPQKAAQFYQQSHQVLATRNLLLLQSLVSKNEGWLGFFHKDYGQVKSALHKAASEAKLADEPLAEIEAYTLQSILASKLGHNKEKYDYLHKAKALLLDYQLDKSNFAVIYYHFALFAETPEQAKPHFEKILQLPYKPDNAWIIEDAQANLSRYYLKQQLWSQALELFPDHQLNPFSYNQRAQIYYAMGDQAKALSNVKTAFSEARIQYNHSESLNAALLLYQISVNSADVTGEIEYSAYIRKNAFKHWLDRHQDVLKTLGYFAPPQPTEAPSSSGLN